MPGDEPTDFVGPVMIAQPASTIERVEPREREAWVVANIMEPGGGTRRTSPVRLDNVRDALDLRSNRRRVGEPSIKPMEKASSERFCGRLSRRSFINAASGQLEHRRFRDCIFI